MSVIKQVINGYGQRIALENSLTLQAAKLVRPAQIKLKVATTLNDIETQLDADPKLKAQFKKVNITLPTND